MKNSNSEQFLTTVRQTKPKIAVFDCDGTLWTNNSGEDFFYWSLDRGLTSPEITKWAKARYADYMKGNVDETVMCGEMTSMYAGLRVTDLEAAAKEFFAEFVKPNYFEEMRSLTLQLAESGCELWAVSSTNEWVIREGIRDFGIPETNILAASVLIQDEVATGELIRVPSAEGKAVAIEEVINRPVDAVFGNSIFDAAMLELARDAYAVNPNPDLEELAAKNGWTIYWPELMRQVNA